MSTSTLVLGKVLLTAADLYLCFHRAWCGAQRWGAGLLGDGILAEILSCFQNISAFILKETRLENESPSSSLSLFFRGVSPGQTQGCSRAFLIIWLHRNKTEWNQTKTPKQLKHFALFSFLTNTLKSIHNNTAEISFVIKCLHPLYRSAYKTIIYVPQKSSYT